MTQTLIFADKPASSQSASQSASHSSVSQVDAGQLDRTPEALAHRTHPDTKDTPCNASIKVKILKKSNQQLAKMYTNRSINRWLLVSLALLAAASVQAKPFAGPIQDQEDPMMALPSGHQQIVVEHQQQQQQPQTEVQYVYQTVGEQQPQQVQYVQEQHPQPAPFQLQVQMTAEPQQVATHSHNGAPCNQRHPTDQSQQQQASTGDGATTSNEYPGEILYVGQNSEINYPNSPNGRGQYEVSDVTASLGQASGVPATILTEVPLRDMPEDVLAKLRKDYGVKVVATRERPGANLVINCDDSAGQENSICSRQTQIYDSQPPRGPYGYPSTPTIVEEHHHHYHASIEHSHEQPLQPPGEHEHAYTDSPVEAETPESHLIEYSPSPAEPSAQEHYEHSDGASAEEEQPQTYGSRNSAQSEQQASNLGDSPTEAAPESTPETSTGSLETETQHVGGLDEHSKGAEGEQGRTRSATNNLSGQESYHATH